MLPKRSSSISTVSRWANRRKLTTKGSYFKAQQPPVFTKEVLNGLRKEVTYFEFLQFVNVLNHQDFADCEPSPLTRSHFDTMQKLSAIVTPTVPFEHPNCKSAYAVVRKTRHT